MILSVPRLLKKLSSLKLKLKKAPVVKKKINYFSRIKKINLTILNKGFFLKFRSFYRYLQLFFIFFYYKLKFTYFKKLNFVKFKMQYLILNRTLNLFYKNFYYNCIFRKTKSNLFITIINRFGEVIKSYSSGRIKLFKKKKKRKSLNSLPSLIKLITYFLRKKKFLIYIRCI